MAASGKWGPTRVAAAIISATSASRDLAPSGGPAAVERVLRAHLAAGRNFRGVRTFSLAAWPPTPGVLDPNPLDNPTFVAGVEVINRLGLILEVYCGVNLEDGFERVAQLATLFPQLTIVLNHCGARAGPALLSSPALFGRWKAGMGAVAAAGGRNVVCKLGGIQMDMNGFGWESLPAPPSSTTIAAATFPYPRHPPVQRPRVWRYRGAHD
jgi:L-fuconolactonase